MKIKLSLFGIVLFLLIVQISLASTQDLTYDSATKQVNITYDSLNRILTKNTSSVSINYTYDDRYQGTLTNISFDNSTYKYDYDDKLRLTKETKIIDGVAFERRLYYDSMDRIVKQTFTPGTDLNYTYNNQSKINKIIGLVTSTFHNAFDNPLNRTYNNNRVTEFSYDNKGRITEIKTGSLQNLSYSYDAVGNIIRINDSANGRLYKMSYDYLDRLINTSIGGINYVYSYNEIGNILKMVRDNVNTTKFVYGTNPVHAPSKIVTNDAGIDVSKLRELYSNTKQRIISFFLANEKNSTITNANWTVNFEDNNKINSTVAFSLTTNETIWVITGYNYSSGGTYRINITGMSATSSIDFENVSIKFGINAPSLLALSRNITRTMFDFRIFNDMSSASQNVSWSCSEGISSNENFTLAGNETIIILVDHNYSSSGGKTFSCSASSVDGNDGKAVEFEIKGIRIENYNSTALVENRRMVNFIIRNYYHPTVITWYITSDGQTFTNTTSTLSTNGTASISQTINYTTDGKKDILVNISSGEMTDGYNETFIVRSLRIEDYDSRNLTSTNRLLQFIIKNIWPQNQSVRWNVTNPSITSNNDVNLISGESVFILVENNYTTQGTKKLQITAYNNTFTDSFADRFFVKVIEILRHLVLKESQSSTVSEMDVINNLGRTNVSWIIDTGEQNISSTQPTTLNNTEQIIIIIESNYTAPNVYITKSTVDSSSYNDTSTGVVVN